METTIEHVGLWKQQLQQQLVENGRLGYATDGIVDETEWGKTSPKLLFLLKEPPGKKNKRFDLTEFLRNGAKRSVDQTWRYLAMWVYCAYHSDEKLSYRDQIKPVSITAERRSKWLCKIAAVNVKKQPGETYTKTNVLKEEFKRFYAPYVAKQLKEITDVDVIVCCGKGIFSCLRTIFEEVFNEPYDKSVWVEFCHLGNLKNPIRFYKTDNTPLIIDYCHPGAHINGKAMATTLQRLIKEHAEIKDKASL